MGKITVKHYLNTNLKPKEIDGKNYYPVYINIIYKKFTTDKKSSAVLLVTENSYNNYITDGQWIKSEWVDFGLLLWDLNKEVNVIKNAIRVIDEWNINVDRKSILYLIGRFSEIAEYHIIKCYFDDLDIQHSIMREPDNEPDKENNKSAIKYIEFLMAFAKKNTLDNMQAIKSYTGVDLMKFLKPETEMDMNAIDLVSKIQDIEKKQCYELYKHYPNNMLTFGEFVFCNYEEKINALLGDKTLSYSEDVKKALNELIDNTISHDALMCGIEL